MADPPADLVEFTVVGEPQQGGSKKTLPHRYTGRRIVIDDNSDVKQWMRAVGWEGKKAMVGRKPFAGPVVLEIDFYMPRPKGHSGTGRNAGTLKSWAPPFPIVQPDLTKLTRSTEDGLKMIAWLDDSQVVEQHIRKFYADNNKPCAAIRVYAKLLP